MKSIPEALQQAVERDGFLHFGLANGVLNLTKTAKFLRPLIESRTKKSVSVSALTMALSRLKFKKRKTNTHLRNIKLTALNIHKNLVEVTYEHTVQNVAAIEKAEKEVRRGGAYIAITFGTTEVTILIDAEHVSQITHLVSSRPKVTIRGLAAVAVQFDETYIPHVGMVYALIQQMTFQNINIIEFSSTYTELVFYVSEKDLRLTFDTLYDQFM
jgi:aspartokinase